MTRRRFCWLRRSHGARDRRFPVLPLGRGEVDLLADGSGDILKGLLKPGGHGVFLSRRWRRARTMFCLRRTSGWRRTPSTGSSANMNKADFDKDSASMPEASIDEVLGAMACRSRPVSPLVEPGTETPEVTEIFDPVLRPLRDVPKSIQLLAHAPGTAKSFLKFDEEIKVAALRAGERERSRMQVLATLKPRSTIPVITAHTTTSISHAGWAITTRSWPRSLPVRGTK